MPIAYFGWFLGLWLVVEDKLELQCSISILHLSLLCRQTTVLCCVVKLCVISIQDKLNDTKRFLFVSPQLIITQFLLLFQPHIYRLGSVHCNCLLAHIRYSQLTKTKYSWTLANSKNYLPQPPLLPKHHATAWTDKSTPRQCRHTCTYKKLLVLM